MSVHVKLRRGEEVVNTELTEAAPVRPVLGKGEAFAAVGQELRGFRPWSVSEDGVMRSEYLLGEGRRGDEDGRDGAKAEVEDWAVDLGELGYSSVGEGSECEEVSDDGEGTRARREMVGRSPARFP